MILEIFVALSILVGGALAFYTISKRQLRHEVVRARLKRRDIEHDRDILSLYQESIESKYKQMHETDDAEEIEYLLEVVSCIEVWHDRLEAQFTREWKSL